ncbi:cation diffusion facilitator family transporter [Colletotrichum graminicola]|uniref:Cation diffusion facilitator family transporter n=1 Tax=Colletotrichum graminicola (strain M1.001 / M2 / FGSC 10212) TaxID=645133 RepID=E3Q466_COLGM|nr:cation diffusion facilitator family transporter [Colletotrichum graminicola M1.001]EFQ25378.1 cation diffusion facilitator family transporter [Colletotrichum graminicola M1.001]WDK11381.1 cation diffusion facilitator family transporter [Colletotrichum graminicola]
MAWSKSTRISIMLAIDVVFFLVELIVGLLVKSLALTADAFHMLNDIISLCVGLWAVSVASKATTDKYSYGWLRAEILGAFFNAVFLIALCVSIILEAISRFFDPPQIDNPQLILIVGSFGLASNLVGFFVLGGHGHSHGDDHSHDHGEHAHAHSDEHAAEEGRANLAGAAANNDSGNVGDLYPEAIVARATAGPDTSRRIRFERDSDPSGRAPSHASSTSKSHDRRRTSSRHHSRLTSIEDISIHPSSFRQEIIDASRSQPDNLESASESEVDETVVEDGEPNEESPLLKSNDNKQTYMIDGGHRGRAAAKRPRRESSLHHEHNHNKERKKVSGGHGHNHADMGMNAMVLHVIGDALGNVGVIVTALIIWLTNWPGRFYADPAVSLFITLIILKSAIPLTKATSKVLLQATPDNIDLQEVREDIQNLPGVLSCHHVHIWQLSDTKIVASLHVHVNFPISAEGGEKYMELAKRARKCLHAYGIHAATIQPEFCGDDEHHHEEEQMVQYDGNGSVGSPKQTCLLECVDNCAAGGCCSESTVAGSLGSQSVHSHDGHGHDHDHSHDHGNGHSHSH